MIQDLIVMQSDEKSLGWWTKFREASFCVEVLEKMVCASFPLFPWASVCYSVWVWIPFGADCSRFLYQ